MATSLGEHQAIVDAILGLDGARAENLVREHIVVQGDRFSDLLASLQHAGANVS
jgi:DNA-binding GntR family transcriptional regulator